MACRRVVQERMIPWTGTAAIEACQADVETSFIVYGVETLSAVFTVDALGRSGRMKVLRVGVRALHDKERGDGEN